MNYLTRSTNTLCSSMIKYLCSTLLYKWNHQTWLKQIEMKREPYGSVVNRTNRAARSSHFTPVQTKWMSFIYYPLPGDRTIRAGQLKTLLAEKKLLLYVILEWMFWMAETLQGDICSKNCHLMKTVRRNYILSIRYIYNLHIAPRITVKQISRGSSLYIHVV